QRIAGQVPGSGGQRGGIDGVGSEITDRFKGRNLAGDIIGNDSCYGSCPRTSHQQAGRVDRQRVHRLAEGGVDGLVDRHRGGGIGGGGETHRRGGGVQGRTGSKAPDKTICQRIACQVLGPGGNRGCISSARCEIV